MLDDLANISISNHTGQLIAISLHLKLEKRKIFLIVAEKGKVKDGGLEYLSQLWDILRQFLVKFAKIINYYGNLPGSQFLQLPRVSSNMLSDFVCDI